MMDHNMVNSKKLMINLKNTFESNVIFANMY